MDGQGRACLEGLRRWGRLGGHENMGKKKMREPLEISAQACAGIFNSYGEVNIVSSGRYEISFMERMRGVSGA